MMASRHARFDPSNRKKEEQEELLVFGYSCKLFRDDEKALYIDQGKHLIPWMGDDTLKIDRYDVRGTVADLRPLEPLPGGATEAQWSSLSDSERKAEQLCDEERYRALYHNEAEEALYQEEELKRLHQALDSQHSYGQVAYNYEDVNAAEQQSQESALTSGDAEEEEDQPFVAPAELDIPVGMVLPDKCKLNAIIEKTALFISTQGPQMEIILKTKQANNPQFEFLSFDCPLHAYYRHLLMAIKTGRYRPQEQQQEKEQQESDADDNYLHPSLAPPPARVELAPSIPSINYKPSADCAYSLLVSKIKDKQLKNADTNSGPSSPQPSLALPYYSKRRKAGYPSSGSSTRSGSRTGSSSSGTESSSDSEEGTGTSGRGTSALLIPPNDIQLIVDKMASYVLKNGRDFESVVRSKGDARFGFLDASHEYHPYYEHKIRVYQGVEPPYVSGQGGHPARPERKKDKIKKEKIKSLLLPQYESSSGSDSDTPRTSKKGKVSKTQAPVSFSIKKPKETEILQEIRSALPLDLEESSDNEDDEDKERKEKESSECKSSSKEERDSRRMKKEEKTATEEVDYEKIREEELRKTRKLLKEKEMQLREKEKEKEREREREIEKKRNEDIFPTAVVGRGKTEEQKNLSDQLVDLMNSTKQEKKPSREKQEKRSSNEKQDRKSPGEKRERKSFSGKQERRTPSERQDRKSSSEVQDRKSPGEKQDRKSRSEKQDRKSPSEKQDRKSPSEKQDRKSSDKQDRKSPIERQDRNSPSEKQDRKSSEKLERQYSDEREERKPPKENQESIVDIDDDLITETEIIDLTDDKVVVPKNKEISLKLERKRRAAAFLSRLKNDQRAPSNGTSKVSKEDTDMSVPSPPSPPRLTEMNGSTVPKQSSLLARLAASNVVSKQPPSISVDRKHKRRKSETPKKRSRSRSSSPGRQSQRNRKHKKKKYNSPDRERTRSTSRSRSRSVMSPTKVYHRRHRDYDQDHKYNSHYDYDRDESSSSRHKSFKHKIHKHSKHRRERRSSENEGDEEMTTSQKYKYKHRSKNGQSSDSSGE